MQLNLLNDGNKYSKKDYVVDLIIGFTALILVAFLFFTSQFWISTVRVQQTSMTNTLQDGDVLILDKLASPKRGDVIVFKQAENNDYIKRVIAVEGDTVYTQNGIVYVYYQLDGKTVHLKLNEDYIKQPELGTYLYDTKTDIPKVTLGKGEYFVLGDNRMNSVDSRTYFDSYGNVNQNVNNSGYVGIVKQSQVKGVVHQFWINCKNFTTKIFGD